MKILQVYPLSMKVRGGGVSEHVWNVSKLLARKHDVTLFGLNPRGKYSRFDVVDGVKVERFRHFYPQSSYFFSFQLPLRLRQVNFDVVHAHGYHAFPMHFARLAKCDKFVVTTHFHGEGHSVFRDSLFKLFHFFGKSSLKKADTIIAVSEFEKELLCKQFGIVEDKIVVVPNGLNFDEFIDLRRHDYAFKSVLYVGRLDEYKGVHYLVEVLPKLDKDVVLHIVGKGPLRKQLKDRARQLGVLDRVFFFDNLSRKDLLQKYIDCDVFVSLSRLEAFSITVAEALKAGAFCVVANTSALCEWIDNERCFGVEYPIRVNELAKILRNVLGRNNNQKMVFSTKIEEKILDWTEVANRLEKLYEMK